MIRREPAKPLKSVQAVFMIPFPFRGNNVFNAPTTILIKSDVFSIKPLPKIVTNWLYTNSCIYFPPFVYVHGKSPWTHHTSYLAK